MDIPGLFVRIFTHLEDSGGTGEEGENPGECGCREENPGRPGGGAILAEVRDCTGKENRERGGAAPAREKERGPAAVRPQNPVFSVLQSQTAVFFSQGMETKPPLGEIVWPVR